MKINRAFIKGTNWALAGLISLLGFSSCEKDIMVEYGAPNVDYTVKGAVVNKANGKPIAGIRVGYTSYAIAVPMYGTIPTPYEPKASVTTNAKGEFKLIYNFYPGEFYVGADGLVPVYVEDIDGEKNGLFHSETLQIDFSKAEQSKKPKGLYEGEYTVTVKVEMTEVKNK